MKRSPIVALPGARQCGKTSLARLASAEITSTAFDLESTKDFAWLQNPELALSMTTGLVVIDEIQRRPDLFEVLRVLVDRENAPGRFPALVPGRHRG